MSRLALVSLMLTVFVACDSGKSNTAPTKPTKATKPPAQVYTDGDVPTSAIIGNIPTNDERAYSHLRSLLDKDGIPTSVAYGIQVSATHADKAIEILKEDSAAHQCSITVYDKPFYYSSGR